MDDPLYRCQFHPSVLTLADQIPRFKDNLNILILFWAKRGIHVFGKAFTFEVAGSS